MTDCIWAVLGYAVYQSHILIQQAFVERQILQYDSEGEYHFQNMFNFQLGELCQYRRKTRELRIFVASFPSVPVALFP